MNLQETIRRVLKEETEGIQPFLDRILLTYPQTENYIDKIQSFIEKSNCKKIEVSKFKHPAMGLALHNGVLFNEMIFSMPLSRFLFIVFHEIAHQYQYKKYGDEKMYEFYLGDIPVQEAAKVMKEIEIIADEFALRKTREFVKLGLIDKVPSPAGIYKYAHLSHFENLITQIKNILEEDGVMDYDGIVETFYNMVKSNT